MRSKFLLPLLFISLNNWSQDNLMVALHVDVLGKKQDLVRYYHPIEGIYEITRSQFFNDKRIQQAIPYCVFIDPRVHLTDSVTHIQANSLRYYIDPSELLYVEWQLTSDTVSCSEFNEFKESATKIRATKYQDLVENYFKPFYFRKYEVTNREYREFVYWVRDSIFKEAVYVSEKFTDEEVFAMLNANSKSVYFDENDLIWKIPDLANRSENRKYFSFKQDFDVWEKMDHERLVPVTYQFYLHPNERWYKRRELDVTKLVYRFFENGQERYKADVDTLENIEDSLRKNNLYNQYDLSKHYGINELVIYPDTLSWLRDTRYAYNDPFTNLYFWHPAYDNYPVNGVSWEQAKAFCHWKEQQFYAKNPTWGQQFSFDLPNPQEYEWAICAPYQNLMASSIQDDNLVTDLLLDWSSGNYGQFHELLLLNAIGFSEKVSLPFDATNQAELKSMQRGILKKLNEDNTDEIQELTYYVSLMRSTQNYLVNDIRFLSNNLSEWMNADFKTHYEKLFQAYQNYNCYADISYCENQRDIELANFIENDTTGKMILGANWFDERYGMILGVNTEGLYAKRFANPEKAYSTVGFRYVVRIKD